MRSRKTIRRLFARGEDRGAIAVILALGMTVLLGSAALAIDLGHLMNVRTESQRVADLSALAGASGFIDAIGPTLNTVIDTRAKQFAAVNEVNQSGVTLASADIDIDVANERVRVTVYHTQARGNPVQTIFARILGINDVDVVTTAVAQAFPAGGATCILPFMLPDKYLEGGAPSDPNLYDMAPPDYYEPFDPMNPSPTATGYTEADKGLQLIIKGYQGNNPEMPNPSWYYPIALFNTGGNAYRDAIATCVDPTEIFAIGDVVPVEPGAMVGPTKQGIDALIAQAPTHAWHVANKCVVDTAAPDPNLCLGGSARLRPVPMMAPPDAPAKGGRKDVPIMNWAAVFVEGMQGNDVVVRFAGYSGVEPYQNPSGGVTGLPKVIRLVE